MNRKYVIVCGTLCQGGAERVISILSKEMVQRGYPVEILYIMTGRSFMRLIRRFELLRWKKKLDKRTC